MIQGDLKTTAEFFLNTRMGLAMWPAKSRSDFGPPSSVGRQVRRLGVDHESLREIDPETCRDFGIYWGEHGGKFVVALKHFLTWKPVGCEIFDDLNELKQHWELD